MNPWALWLDPWDTYLDQWSKALGGDIFRLHHTRGAKSVTERQSFTPFRVALEGDNFALLEFSRAPQDKAIPPTVIVAPYALHDWRVADLAHHHSLVEVLRHHGVSALYVLAWKSAEFKTRHNRIDSQFEALEKVCAYFSAPFQVIGLCQGGWLALAYAARYPAAFSCLAMIGTPVDFSQSQNAIHAMDDNLIDASINWLSLAGGGVIRGWSTQSLWKIKFGNSSERSMLLQESEASLVQNKTLYNAYTEWDEDVLDLPPAYFGDVLKHLYRDNEIVKGQFKVLGHIISLRNVTCPILIMVGQQDEVVSDQQIDVILNSVSTPRRLITVLEADCGHLALFLGRDTLDNQWPDIARWLRDNHLKKTH